MTGSGKSGLVTVLIEEALSAGVPTIIIDVKGDLAQSASHLPELRPWTNGALGRSRRGNGRGFQLGACNPAVRCSAEGPRRRRHRRTRASEVLRHDFDSRDYTRGNRRRIVTRALGARATLVALGHGYPESARNALSAAVSLVLRLLGRDPDPAKSREHVLLSVLAERRLAAGQNADIGSLMQDLTSPPISQIGALPLNSFLKKRERSNLAAALNNLLASPTFCSWRKGTSLDIADWVAPKDGRTPAVIVSVAHLDEEERALVLGVLLEEILSWVRGLPGSERLKALIVFDEVYGFLPPHPANPPTKRPIVALMKQARAFGVGVIVATQNPMDLDYRALSNAGLWCIGRLQTDADRARVLDGIAGTSQNKDGTQADLGRVVQRLAPRWFIVKNAHAADVGPVLLNPRNTMSLMRGPMTRTEILKAREWRAEVDGIELPPISIARPPVVVEVPESL